SYLLGELLRIELERRRKLGEGPTAEEYRRRLPGFEAVIAAVLPAGPATPAPQAGSTLGADPPGGAALRAAPPLACPASGPALPCLELSAQDEPLALPARAGRYVVEGVIAPGGMGVVLRARDGSLKR